MEEAGISR